MSLQLSFMVFLLALISIGAQGYKPVVLIHGIVTGAPSMMLIEEEIMRVKPVKCTLWFTSSSY